MRRENKLILPFGLAALMSLQNQPELAALSFFVGVTDEDT